MINELCKICSSIPYYLVFCHQRADLKINNYDSNKITMLSTKLMNH